MRLRPLALLLLLALALRLGVGPHPCHAMGAMARPAAAPAAAPCHQEPRPKAPASGDEDCCGNGGPLCANACQTAAVLRVALVPPVAAPFSTQLVATEHRATPPVVFPIDHIPLA